MGMLTWQWRRPRGDARKRVPICGATWGADVRVVRYEQPDMGAIWHTVKDLT
jgi:hypothetical protein